MVEQLTVNQPVVGSNPASGAIQNNKKSPDVMSGLFLLFCMARALELKTTTPYSGHAKSVSNSALP